jgi:transposase-like protein
MDASEHDVLAYMAFPRQHRTKLHSTNPMRTSVQKSSTVAAG